MSFPQDCPADFHVRTKTLQPGILPVHVLDSFPLISADATDRLPVPTAALIGDGNLSAELV